MVIQRLIRPALLVSGSVLVVAMTAGCQGGFNATGSVSDNPATATLANSAGSSSGSSGGSSANSSGGSSNISNGHGNNGTAGAAKRPECKAANLKLSFGEGEGGGAGSFYPALQFTNTGKASCVLVGFPGVSYVTGDNGQQVGAPAQRDGSIGKQVTLAPGQMGSAIVQEANTENYPPEDCKPVPVRGFRVYAPDDTAAMFIPFNSPDATACSSTNMPGGPQLSVQTVKAGPGNA